MYTLEYIWLDKDGFTRSKIRTIWENYHVGTIPKPPNWNFDASSTGQNIGDDTEAVLKPVRIYNDPLTITPSNNPHFLVLCQLDLEYDTISPKIANVPVKGFNTRYWASQIAKKYSNYDSWFGLEQEYTFLDPKTNLPYNWEEYGCKKQGNYYCSVRYPYCQLNELVRQHYRVCLEAGLKINGLNAEVLPSQWEFQIGPADLLKSSDDLIMARYFLCRLAAKKGVKVSFHPKPMKGDWNGSGCHINFSTNEMRNDMKYILDAISNLEKDHPKILQYYGENNDMRLTGELETSSVQTFSWGVGTRNTSIRIPNQVQNNGGGYLEDRRPASNIDPYLALGKIMQVSLGT